MLQLPNVFLSFESDTRFTIVGAGSYNHTTRRSTLDAPRLPRTRGHDGCAVCHHFDHHPHLEHVSSPQVPLLATASG
jgi:hypothetical protein